MTEEILQLLDIAPGPQTAAEICDSLRRRRVKVEEFQLVEHLRRLQRDGFVRLEGIRWRLLKMPIDVNLARSPPPRVSTASVSLASDGVSQGQQVAYIPPVSPPLPAGRWALFRRLCRYYMDCLLQDEAPRLWHSLRRRQLEARRRATRQPLLGLPNPFPDRALPNGAASTEAWNDFFPTWKVWAEAARVAGLVASCEQRVAQLPKAEECNRKLAGAQQDIEKTTHEWMAWAAGGLPNPLAPAEREVLANLRAGIQNWGGCPLCTRTQQALSSHSAGVSAVVGI
jgi:hypothetical protein